MVLHHAKNDISDFAIRLTVIGPFKRKGVFEHLTGGLESNPMIGVVFGGFEGLSLDRVDCTRYGGFMKVATGKVLSGKIVVDGDPFPEGSIVTVIASEDGEAFRLGTDDEAALLASIAEAERGDVIDGAQFLRDLDRRE